LGINKGLTQHLQALLHLHANTTFDFFYSYVENETKISRKTFKRFSMRNTEETYREKCLLVLISLNLLGTDTAHTCLHAAFR
jgi:hypothetical protein